MLLIMREPVSYHCQLCIKRECSHRAHSEFCVVLLPNNGIMEQRQSSKPFQGRLIIKGRWHIFLEHSR